MVSVTREMGPEAFSQGFALSSRAIRRSARDYCPIGEDIEPFRKRAVNPNPGLDVSGLGG